MNLTILQKIYLFAILLIISGVLLLSGNYTHFWTGILYGIVGFSAAGLLAQGVNHLTKGQS
jgi:predicted cobalt transporter CbtA